jgi:hypothetical protein
MSTIKKANLILCLVVLLSLLGGGQGIGHAKGQKTTAKPFLISNDALNPDGTLKLDGSYMGSIDLRNWDVQLDPNNGPVFRAAAEALEAPGWSALDDGYSDDGSIYGEVWAISVQGSDVYVGGNFTDVHGNPAADYIAKWDGTNWSALGSNGAGNGSLNQFVKSIVIDGANIYVGGAFENVNNNGTILTAADCIARWDGMNWSALGSNGGGNGSLNGSVTDLVLSSGNLYVGGIFTDVNNHGIVLTAADYIATWDGANWSALGSDGAGNGSLNGTPRALASYGSNVYVGGEFTNINNHGVVLTAADYIAKWDGANWSALGSDGAGNGSLNDTVFDIAIDGNIVYAGGVFMDVNNNGSVLNAADFISKWDGANWSSLGSTRSGNGALNGSILAIVVYNHNVYVGGYADDFLNNGVLVDAADYIAKWDGANWSALGSNGIGDGSLNGSVWALAVDSKVLYAGGMFTNVNNEGTEINHADYIAKYRGLFTFTDVPLNHMFWKQIEAFYDAGITTGCSTNPMKFCPLANVTRGEMAVFLERAMGNFNPNPNPTEMFTDVPYLGQPAFFQAFIEEFYNDGITTGCSTNPMKYCPQNYVTRGEMAVFIERALGNYNPTPSQTGMFADVPNLNQPASFQAFIEQFYLDGITIGCAQNPLRYCPMNKVTRQEMAVFIVRAFGIPLP